MRVLIKSCWANKEKTKTLFSKFTKEYLDNLKATVGTFHFAKQYENSVVDDSSADFKKSWLEKEYEEDDIANIPLRTFITIDTSFSTKDSADYTGVIVNSVDANHNWYLRYVKRLRPNITQLVELIFDLWNNREWKRSNLVKIGIERKAFIDSLLPMIKEESAKRGVFPTVEELKDLGKNKEQRIRGLIPRFEYGKVFFKKNATDDSDWLKEELLKFPFSEKDDLADSAAYQLVIATAPHHTAKVNLDLLNDDPEWKQVQNEKRFARERSLVINRI